MMNNNEILKKAMDRADEINAQNNKKKTKIYIATSVMLSLIIIISLSVYIPYSLENVNAVVNNPNMGTYFSNTTYLGYVIIGIIAFLLGVIVTLICYKIKNERK